MSERLTDDALQRIEAWASDARIHYNRTGLIRVGLALDTFDRVPELVAELRERRAADLTAEEREALAWLVRHWGRHLGPMVMNDPAYKQKRAALAALDKLIGGGKP